MKKSNSSSLKFKTLAISLTFFFHLGLFACITFDGENTFWLHYLPESIQDKLVSPDSVQVENKKKDEILRP
ncbi:MAG: hypothetical protein MK226_09215 [Saprospiraceae bacterium]|nr:hypothetical protein [Saprospiraceae bacterium]